MKKEIGSHFEYDFSLDKPNSDIVEWLPSLYDRHFTFSGRSAIELVIEDILLNRKVKRVYMPSYCCKSMVDPFIKKKIEVIYYKVNYEKGKGIQYNINVDMECDIFFAMSYFGIEEFQLEGYLQLFSSRDTIILEDITHRLLNEKSYSVNADYVIASLRKWFPIASGGIAAKQNDSFKLKPLLNSDIIVEPKINSMKDKTAYLNNKNIDKESILFEMAEFEKNFKIIDLHYCMDNVSMKLLNNLDIPKIQERRQENASVLYEGIRSLEYINLLIPNIDFNTHTPLFLPVMLEESNRNSLRTYLIKNNIYCPVHWPNSEENYSEISKNVLSLVCDQRYSINDMKCILNLIQEWYKLTYDD